MIPDRFKQFENTKIFEEYSECFEFTKIYDITKLEYYTNRLRSLKIYLGYEFTLSTNNVLRYITTNEKINDKYAESFILFCKIIAEKYAEYVTELKKAFNKEQEALQKRAQKEVLNEPKNIEKKQEIETRDKIREERIAKKEAEALRILYSKEIIQCECSYKCIRYKMNIHLLGKEHQIGMNAITYYKHLNGIV